MTLATHDEEIVDAEVVEDFDVDDVFKPRPVREVEVYVEDSLERAVRLTREAWARKDAAAVEVAAGIACMVKRGAGQGTSRSQDREVEVSVIEASRRLRKAEKTIRAYLDTWDRLAANGLCAPSTELTPDDLDNLVLPSPEDWQAEWQGNSHSTPAPVFGERGGPTIPRMDDWPEVPEPESTLTSEERAAKFEETRQRLIADGLIPPDRTPEEKEEAAERFVSNLLGKATPKPRAAETPAARWKRALSTITALMDEGEAPDTSTLTDGERAVYKRLTREEQ